MKNELIQFSPEEMKGCPPFTSTYKWGKVKFLYATSGMNVYMIEDEDGSYMYGDTANPFMCKPEDRMNAFCKHLFELMPDMKRIYYNTNQSITVAENDKPYYNSFHRFCYIKVNPFLECDIDGIDKEDLK